MRTLAIFLVFIACGINFVQAGDSAAGGCPSVQRYAVGGHGNPSSTGVPAPYPRVNITYPADALRGDYSRAVAIRKLDAAARQMRAWCPQTRIEVYGYSLGASAASLVVDSWQFDPRMNHNTIAVFYGNPRRPITRSGYGGIEATGLPNIPNHYTWRGARRSGPIPVTDICNEGRDIICSSPVPIHRDLPHAWRALHGYLTTGHHY